MPRKPTTRPTETAGKPKPARSRKPRARTAESKAGSSAPKDLTSPWEWVAAALGAAILAGLVGFLVYAGVTRTEAPMPDIVATPAPPVRLGSGTYLMPLRVENLGHATGANVTVRGSLADAAGTVLEESATTFDFVAQHSVETGGLLFTADPRSGTLSVRVEGYADP
ncbi:MAG: hypothetical protein J0H08_09595 [Rhizobiales bacterium]|nr:hypothetical protein [Hyphomicrobiales bacterium]